jgi:hypothetical protein
MSCFSKDEIIKYSISKWTGGVCSAVLEYYIYTDKLISKPTYGEKRYQLDELVSRFDLENLEELRKEGIL